MQLFCGKTKFAPDIWEQRICLKLHNVVNIQFSKTNNCETVFRHVCKSLQEDSKSDKSVIIFNLSYIFNMPHYNVG